jgi:hypothetical protein
LLAFSLIGNTACFTASGLSNSTITRRLRYDAIERLRVSAAHENSAMT